MRRDRGDAIGTRLEPKSWPLVSTAVTISMPDRRPFYRTQDEGLQQNLRSDRRMLRAVRRRWDEARTIGRYAKSGCATVDADDHANGRVEWQWRAARSARAYWC
jgi:DNA-binding transcriptional regulator PaaX